mmetsp:Transcript_41928/g.99431  ORF Transcript_41928/g.99431 Transcript_41928/m.99431 type:complete len:91 (+) Transcript_41928:451-723(+)
MGAACSTAGGEGAAEAPAALPPSSKPKPEKEQVADGEVETPEEDTRAWRRGDQLDVSRLTKPLFIVSMGSEMIDVLHQRLADKVRRRFRV